LSEEIELVHLKSPPHNYLEFVEEAHDEVINFSIYHIHRKTTNIYREMIKRSKKKVMSRKEEMK
jgi:hypothetical protein